METLSLVIIFLGFSLIGIYFYTKPSGLLEVNFLDVGQGDAILIKDCLGKTILIDGGPDKTILQQLGKVLPWYDKTIDLMILTHNHDDHLVGLLEVLKKYKIEHIIYPNTAIKSSNYSSWLKLARERKIDLLNITNLNKLILSCGYFSILSKGIIDGNINNESLVLKLNYNKTSFLLAGDAEKEVENKLIEQKIVTSKINVFKLSHHGSDTANTENFLNIIKPDIAIIEVGKNNKFGHPSLRIINRLKRLGTKIFRTDNNGNIKIFSNGFSLSF